MSSHCNFLNMSAVSNNSSLTHAAPGHFNSDHTSGVTVGSVPPNVFSDMSKGVLDS